MKRSSGSTWKSRYSRTILASAVLTLAPTIALLAHAQTTLPADAKPTCTVTDPQFASWFKSGAVTLDGEVNPANSVTFPDVPNCSFYQWSEQMFFWLNSPTPATYGGGGGRIFDSPAFFDVSAPDANGERHFIPHHAGMPKLINVRSSQVGPNGLPIIFDKRGRMLEVLPAPLSKSGRSLIRDRTGRLLEIDRVDIRNGKPVFLDKDARKIDVPAGRKIDPTLTPRMSPRLLNNIIVKKVVNPNLVQSFRNGRNGPVIFIDQSGNVIDIGQGQAGGNGVLLAQNGSLVYYSTTVNDVYAYFATGTKNGGITPAPTQFPVSQADLNKITAFAQLHGKTFPDPEALAIEVKSSWIETTGLDVSKYITATAVVPTYDQSSTTQWLPNGTKTVKLALVGMHVVGSTKGHPEMIWATFEHFGNTPDAAYTYTNAANQTVAVPQSPTGTWLFSSTNNSAAAYNNERMSFISPNIVANSGNTIGASDTIRWKAFGAASNLNPNPLVNTTASNTEVISINNSVLGKLLGGDIRGNYMMTGATWTIGGQAPGNSNQVGTSKLANSTMETYHQGSSTAANGTNCFSCHTTNQVSVSHVFDELTPLFP